MHRCTCENPSELVAADSKQAEGERKAVEDYCSTACLDETGQDRRVKKNQIVFGYAGTGHGGACVMTGASFLPQLNRHFVGETLESACAHRLAILSLVAATSSYSFFYYFPSSIAHRSYLLLDPSSYLRFLSTPLTLLLPAHHQRLSRPPPVLKHPRRRLFPRCFLIVPFLCSLYFTLISSSRSLPPRQATV